MTTREQAPAGGLADGGAPGRLLAYFDEQAERADRHWRLARQTGAVEAVHEFRVAVKRLRAFDELACRLDGKFGGRGQLRAVRRLFKACGPLRDVHVQQQLVLGSSGEALPGLSEYFNHLKRLELGARDAFAREARAAPRIRLDRYRSAIAELSERLAGDLLLLRAERHVACSLAALSGRSQPEALDPVVLHQLRIDSKRTRYAVEILVGLRAEPGRLRALNEALLAVHQALGRWHDHQLGEVYLERFLAGRESGPLFDPQAYERLRAHQAEGREAALDLFRVRWSFLQHLLATGSVGVDVLLARELSRLA